VVRKLALCAQTVLTFFLKNSPACGPRPSRSPQVSTRFTEHRILRIQICANYAWLKPSLSRPFHWLALYSELSFPCFLNHVLNLSLLTPMTPYDEAYKSLFQNKELLELLFTPEILGAEWSDLLDFNQARLLPNEQISESLHLRQNDQIWRVRRKGGADDLYILLLLEFQSHVEPTMALRISTYVTLLY